MPTLTETAQYLDEAAWDLANRITDTAEATEGINLEGSRYSIFVLDAAVASEAVALAGAEPNLGDTANATETVTGRRVYTQTDSAVASDSVTLSAAKVTIVVSDSANATEQVSHHQALSISDTAAATETVTGARAATITDAAVASETLTATRKHVATILDSAAATDTDHAPVTHAASDTAAATETVTHSKRAINTVAESAAATESVVSVTTMILRDSAVVADTINGVLKAQQLIDDTAEATETIRLPATEIPVLWTNSMTGAAATWSGLLFNSMVEQDGRLFAAGPDGLYELTATGANDNGDAIAAAVLWDLETFGSRRRKRVRNVYVSAACVGPFAVRVINEQGRFQYLTRLPGIAKARNHRAEPGAGLEASHYRIGVNWTKRDAGVDHVIVEYEDTVRSM